jgi:hypothetical protein
LLRFIQDRLPEPGERRVEIVQQKATSSATLGGGQGDGGGTGERFDQPFRPRGQAGENARGQPALAALVGKWVGDVAHDPMILIFPGRQAPRCILRRGYLNFGAVHFPEVC